MELARSVGTAKHARYLWRFRHHFNPMFKGQALTLQGLLVLPVGRGRNPFRAGLPAEEIPAGTR